MQTVVLIFADQKMWTTLLFINKLMNKRSALNNIKVKSSQQSWLNATKARPRDGATDELLFLPPRLLSFPFHFQQLLHACAQTTTGSTGPAPSPPPPRPPPYCSIQAVRLHTSCVCVCVCGVTSHVGLLLLLLYCWLWTRRDETRRNEEANGQRGRVGMLHAIRQSSSSPKLRPLHFAPNWKGSRLLYRSAQFLFFFYVGMLIIVKW